MRGSAYLQPEAFKLWSDSPVATPIRDNKQEMCMKYFWYLQLLLLAALLSFLSDIVIASDLPSDPISQMEIAFVGNPTKREITTFLDKALSLYDTPINSENYSRAGSSLVALRQQTGVSEMSILRYMIKSHVPGMKINFPEAAGISAAFLATGDK